jgi:uncharacterized protein (DUF697 family)/predicted GTPase
MTPDVPEKLLSRILRAFRWHKAEPSLEEALRLLQSRLPAPVLWLFGKTQSGKTSVVRYLTGAEDAEIGSGYKPTTRFTRRYHFPSEATRLMTFLDTRGLEEPGYDPEEDIRAFDQEAHAMLVTVRAMDHAQGALLRSLEAVRRSNPSRPVILVATCLHEAYPQQQHPSPYPFTKDWNDLPPTVPEALAESLAEQKRRFQGLVDHAVAVDLTKPEEGFHDPAYGGPQLRQTIIDVLPAAYRQVLISFAEASQQLKEIHDRRVSPYLLAYSLAAGSAALVPIPFVHLPVFAAIQVQMVRHLAELYGQPLTGKRFLEAASALGLGIVTRQAVRELAKLVPGVGSLLAAVLAASATYALGKAFSFYYSAVLKGHVPDAEALKKYYQNQLREAEHYWKDRFRQTA